MPKRKVKIFLLNYPLCLFVIRHQYICICACTLLRKVLSTRVSQGECLATSTLHPWIVSLSQKTILAVSFLCCPNFSKENNVQQSFQFTTERNVRRFYYRLIFSFLYDFGRKYVIKNTKVAPKGAKIASNYFKYQ